MQIADRGGTCDVVLPGPHRVHGRRVAGGLTFETSYRRETLEALLAVKGAEWLKDEIDRAEDPDYLPRAVRTIFGRYETFRGRRVLDFGCGCGATTVVLARLGADVVGVDPHAPSVAAAGLRAVDAGVADRARFQHLPDPLRLPFTDGSFDAVLAYQVVEHIPPAARGAHVRELWRVIAPGGRLLLSAPNRLWPVEFHTTGLWWLPWLPDRLAIRYAILRGRLPAGAAQDPHLAEGLRGVSYWQVLRWLPANELRVLNLERRDDLEAWLDVSLARDRSGGRARAKRGLHRLYRALDAHLWHSLGWPAAAFLPYLNVAMEKRG